MAKIHMILQGKGGVGKSFISSTLAQHKVAKGGNPLCIDTDPVNATFYGFKKLNVKQINVMNNDERSNRPSVAMRLKETRWQSLLKKRITRLIMWLNCVS